MNNADYAIVREDQLPRQFLKFHDSFISAQREALRLCEKERTTFLVLKVVGRADIKSATYTIL